MKRKLIIQLVLSAAFMAVTIIFCGALEGRSVLSLLDLKGILLGAVAPFAVTIVAFGLNDTRRAFSIPFAAVSDKAGLKASRAFFKTLLRYIIAFTLFAFAAGMILLLSNLTKVELMGRNLAVILSSILYGSVFAIFIVIPFQSAIEQRLAKKE